MHRHNVAVIVVAGAVFLALATSAAAFGSAPTDTSEEVGDGGDATFTVYLIGENETLQFDGAVKPDGWTVDASPMTVQFPVADEQYRYVPAGSGYRKSVPVTITVSVPDGAASGTYDVVPRFVSGSASATDDDRSRFSVTQVQEFSFTVTVVSSGEDVGESTNESSLFAGVMDRITGAITSGDNETGDIEMNDTQKDSSTGPDDETGDIEEEGEQIDGTRNGSGNGMDHDGGFTGFVSRHGSTLLQGIVFIGIWLVLGVYLWRRRNDSSGSRPWNDSLG